MYAIEINGGAQEPRTLVHKRLTHTVVDRFESITFQVTAILIRENLNLYNQNILTTFFFLFVYIIKFTSFDYVWRLPYSLRGDPGLNSWPRPCRYFDSLIVMDDKLGLIFVCKHLVTVLCEIHCRLQMQ